MLDLSPLNFLPHLTGLPSEDYKRAVDLDPSKMSVCSVERDGRVRVWDTPDSEGVRPLTRTKHFNTYGQALVWAIDFEEKEKAALLRRTTR